MDRDAAVLEWARTATFAQPLRWGEVEAGILGREPAAEPMKPRERLLVGGLAAVGWLTVALMLAISSGAVVIGLVMVLLGARADPPMGEGWYAAAMAAFVLACLAQTTTIRLWWTTGRTRTLFSVLTGAVAVLSSGAAYAALAASDARPDGSWLTVLILATGALGALALALTMFSRPESRSRSRTPPRRGPSDSATWARYRETRAAVLDILVHRGLVKLDQADRIRLLEMPLGYWDELDDVDEVERRRILELRVVGWREFDESDRRPWPPVDSRPA